jgi:hypothetical protein
MGEDKKRVVSNLGSTLCVPRFNALTAVLLLRL